MEHTIFLSYRRDDQPGYVARLADALSREFGDVVFRDVEDIAAGDQWQPLLKKEIARAEVVLAIIGPRWQARLAAADKSAETDYVRLELNTANELGIPVIPVLLDGMQMPSTDTLGDLAWLVKRQVHHLSDSQKRWAFDVSQLTDQIETMTTLEKQRMRFSPVKTLSVLGSVALIGLFAWLAWNKVAPDNATPDEQPVTSIIQHQTGDNGTQIGTVNGTLTINRSESNSEPVDTDKETNP